MFIINIGIENIIWFISIITAIVMAIGFIAIDCDYKIKKKKERNNK